MAAAVGTALSGLLLSPLQLLTKVWPAAETDGLHGFGLGGAMRVMDQVRGILGEDDAWGTTAARDRSGEGPEEYGAYGAEQWRGHHG